MDKKLIAEADCLIEDIQETIWQTQLKQYEAGNSRKKRSPIIFKELPFDSEIYERVLSILKQIIADRRTTALYRKKRDFLLLLSAFCMVRYEPFSGGFWDAFHRKLHPFSFTQSHLFEMMWRAFLNAAIDNWFNVPVISWDNHRLLVHSIYRESKSISFIQIQNFFIRYYTAYDNMRAFDYEYDRWENHPFSRQKEKDENRLLVKDNIERLIAIFNFIEDSDLAFSDTSTAELISKVREHTGIDPLAMFSDSDKLSDLILKVFQKTITLSQFERYLSHQQPGNIKPDWLKGKMLNCKQLLTAGIAYSYYTIDNKVFEVVPRIGLTLEEMVDWPYDRFFDPTNLYLSAKDIEADTVAIRRREPFKVTSEGWQGSNIATGFFIEHFSQSYVWVGKRRIGQKIQTDDIKCPVRQGINFLTSLKYDPREHALKVMLSYVDYFNPRKRYSPIEVILNNDIVIWEGQTDSAGRRNREIYESVSINPEDIPGQASVQIVVDDEPVGSPQLINLDEHILISRYSNSIVSPGRSKFGETQFVLFTQLEEQEIDLSDAVWIKKEHPDFGQYYRYKVQWKHPKESFRLKVNDTEWNFEQAQDIYFVTKFEYNDDLFKISPDLIPYTTNSPEAINFDFHINVPTDQLNLFDFYFSKDGKEMAHGRLTHFLKNLVRVSGGAYRIDYKIFKSLQGDRRLEPGSYRFQIQKGRPGSRAYISKEIRFLILPELSLSPNSVIYLEGETASVDIVANFPCFWDEDQLKYVSARSLDLGPVHLDRNYEENCRISLSLPPILATSSFRPEIFACRLNSIEVAAAISLDALKKTPMDVFGPSGKSLILCSANANDEVSFDENGRFTLNYELIEQHIRFQTTNLQLQTQDKQIDLELQWPPKIQKLGYPEDTASEGKIVAKEAAYEAEIEGPPDGKVLLRLTNNIGETCGEKVIMGSGYFEGVVKWTEDVTPTNTALLKAFILDPDRNAIPADVNELAYNTVTPEKELELSLAQALKDPSNPSPWFNAGVLAYKNTLRSLNDIVEWLNRAVEAGLSDPIQLEEVARIFRETGDVEAAGDVIETIIKLHGATVTSCEQYLDDLLKKLSWDNQTDDAFRGVLEKAKFLGLPLEDFALYVDYRLLKKGQTHDALSSLFELQNRLPNTNNEVSKLIRAAYFKNGDFCRICQMDDANHDIFYHWARWVISPERPFSDEAIIELPEIVWNILNIDEAEVLKTFSSLYHNESQETFKALTECPDCLPGLVTMWAAFRYLEDQKGSRLIYRRLISKNSQFEREITEHGTRCDDTN